MTDYVYICYAHEDTRFALKLAGQLRSQGVPVWLDQWQDADREQWDQFLEDAVRRCRYFLLVLSPAAVSSWLVQSLSLQALQANREIVGLIYQPCPVPELLQGCQLLPYAENSSQVVEDLAGLFRVDKAPTKLTARQRLWFWLGWHSRPVGIGILLLLAGLGLAYFWWQRGPDIVLERAVVPAHVRPLVLAEPLFVPTSEIAAPVGNLAETALESRFRPQDGSEMLLIPGGDFMMGSGQEDAAANNDEFPQHVVYVDAFWMDRTEISNSQYYLCVEAGACEPVAAPSSTFQAAQLPAVGINWQQALTYCGWAEARLPTEAEWEKAARGVDARLYPWGNGFDSSRANYCDTNCVADWRDFGGDDGHRYTAPVGSYSQGASPYGVLDMSGNVWEWTADWYAANTYLTTRYRNPTGPEAGLQRVIRGGSWYYSSRNMRVAQRHKDVPTAGHDNIGFRCVVSDSGISR